ncbi:DUF2277 family protein [Microbacterium sp. KUDC0406]|uniref:DUF2277 family protein n=1 Tax=Microbacterium sp. KUDC0406 TaxID=2909588 RepID=UPI002E375224|nr:DUF2277 family protein [Microbacterium sp. KUDC0406]
MCRDIIALTSFEPTATDEECHDAALQIVRKIAGISDRRASTRSLRPRRPGDHAGNPPGAR